MDPVNNRIDSLTQELDAQDEVARLILAQLSQPFDPSLIKYRKAPGGKQLGYYPFMVIVNRLNEVAPRWSSAVTRQEKEPYGLTSSQEPRVLLMATVALTIPGVDTRSHVGVQVVNAGSGGEDLWKGAVSDGIKKAATLFGLGKELYEDVEVPDYDPGYVPNNSSWQSGAGQSYPPRTSAPAAAPMGGGDGLSQKQLELLTRLAFERGYQVADFGDLPALSKREASELIERLMKEQAKFRLEPGQRPPDEWFGVPF